MLRLRLAIGRFGEMDVAKWWNTNGQLGRYGALALRRGFPRTYHFAQARAVFTVAAHRCAELFDVTGGVTLWRLPARVEEEFDARWEHWLDHATEWNAFFESIETVGSSDLIAWLRTLGLADDRLNDAVGKLRRSAEGRAVLLPGGFSGTNEDVALLAAGFARGEVGALAVPYMRETLA